MYDVFLSHNYQQKPWVRELYLLLKSEGLNVFFDEESVLPGENIVSAIEKAIDNCKYVILVVSSSSTRSKWVAMETQYAVYEDPSGEKGKLVPIILEPVDTQSLRLSVRNINCIHLTDDNTRDERLRKVFKHIGLSNWDTILLPNWPKYRIINAIQLPEVKVAGIDEVLEWGWDGVKLLDEFIKLDFATLVGLKESHEGTSRQWAPVFMEHPETWRMLITSPKNIVGYWHFAPLFPNDFQLATEGHLLDSAITADRIQLFELPGHYRLYFVQICLRERFRKPHVTRLLFSSIFHVIEGLSKEGVFIADVCANAYTDVGQALCKSFNLNHICDHAECGMIFSAPIRNVLQHSIVRDFPDLIHRYHDEGLLDNNCRPTTG